MSTLAAAAWVLAACGDSTGPTMDGTVSLSLASDLAAAGAAAPSRFGASVATGHVTDGDGNVLTFDSVKVVLREIELERREVADCDVEPEPDGCEKFETQPVLAYLPLDGSLVRDISVIMIAPGTYDEVEFDIHEVTGNDDDASFLVAHPEMDGKSIAAFGTYNGEPFAYVSDLNEEQELRLDPVLVVDEGTAGSTNVTLKFELSTWFRDAGGTLFNPETALEGGDNENLAETNIRDSIKGFEDTDEDGHSS
jgi:hypothetical protein